MIPVKKAFQYGDHTVTLETGRIARQASGAVMVNMSDTVVLVTVVGKKDQGEPRDFLPLTVNYQERTYAAGKIPGGFFKREGRPSEKETLVSRLIDRPVRPLFPAGFTNEVQIVATVISMNNEVDADIPAMIGASAALAVSGIPFDSPLGAGRVGYHKGAFVLNPTFSQLESSDLDLVVAGTADAVLMVESEANCLSEQTMLDAVIFGHEQMQTVIAAINELAQEAGKPRWDWAPVEKDQRLAQALTEIAERPLGEAYRVAEKQERLDRVSAVREEVMTRLTLGEEPTEGWSEREIGNAFKGLEKKIVRGSILRGEPRIDGRDNKTVRPISIEVATLPRTHGSAIFTRGETQAIVVTTLGTGRDAQIIDAIEGERKEPFMLHYNFPPYSVGETGFMGVPKRREIGHGRLAKRGIQAVMPSQEECPYVIRVVSEITESNGSSSMATVCGTSLALMDAGVPIKAPVAGIAMGLIKEESEFAVLTDILGDEDHLGDMDFKVAGTSEGVTAIQMDIKIDGIDRAILTQALEQAREGRMHILGKMLEVMKTPRTSLSPYAPKIVIMQINPDKIRDVIGAGGKIINKIIEETGVKIDIEQDGKVFIASSDEQAIVRARQIIEGIVKEVVVGEIYLGTVKRVEKFGAFVEILPGKEGLVHISQLSSERVAKTEDVVKIGDQITVKVTEIDQQGRVNLSRKAVLAAQEPAQS